MFSGVPVVYGINPYETETAPSHALGTVGVVPDGRTYRYARVDASTALVTGNLLQSKAENTSDQGLAVAAAAINAFSIVTTSTVTVDANEYADGYAIVTITPGLGQVFKIKSHPAASAAALTITLAEPIRVALTTDSRIDLVANPYNRVIQHPATATSCPIGVAVVAAAVDTYTWIQTHGIASVLSTGITAVGQSVVANTAAGAVIDEASTTRPVIGYAAAGIASGENGAIFLTID